MPRLPAAERYVTPKERTAVTSPDHFRPRGERSTPRLTPASALEDSTPLLDWEQEDGRNDPRQRFALYRICSDVEREKELLATCATPEAVGVALVTLAREGEFTVDDEPCRFGLLDRMGEKGKRWLILPWGPSPRQVSDAGRLLQSRRIS